MTISADLHQRIVRNLNERTVHRVFGSYHAGKGMILDYEPGKEVRLQAEQKALLEELVGSSAGRAAGC